MIKPGTEVNPMEDPWPKKKPIEVKPESESGFEFSKEDETWIEARIKEHELFRNSPIGKAALHLAEGQMQNILSLLALPVIEFCNRMKVPVDLVSEVRAELRGQYIVWAQILGEPEVLFGLQRSQNKLGQKKE